MKLTPKERLALASSVYNQIFIATNSFEEGHVGADLAYLLAAIIDDGPSRLVGLRRNAPVACPN